MLLLGTGTGLTLVPLTIALAAIVLLIEMRHQPASPAQGAGHLRDVAPARRNTEMAGPTGV